MAYSKLWIWLIEPIVVYSYVVFSPFRYSRYNFKDIDNSKIIRKWWVFAYLSLFLNTVYSILNLLIFNNGCFKKPTHKIPKNFEIGSHKPGEGDCSILLFVMI